MPVQRPYNPDAKRIAEMMQSDLAKVGVNAKLVTYEWGEYRKRLQNGEATAANCSAGRATTATRTTSSSSSAARTASRRPATSASGATRTSTPDLQKARQVADQGERAKIYGDMQVIEHDEEPVMNIAHSVVYQPMSKEVVDFKMSPLGRNQFDGVDLK